MALLSFCPALYDSPGTSYFMGKRKLWLVKPLELSVVNCNWSIATWNDSLSFHGVFQTFSSSSAGSSQTSFKVDINVFPPIFRWGSWGFTDTKCGSKSWDLHSSILSSGPWLFPRKPLLPRSGSELSPSCNTSPLHKRAGWKWKFLRDQGVCELISAP